ncbi:MAG TPA: YigZ family protein [Bacillota bacterium]|nr:YigZ family protein [Bacillota bacterium]
MPAEIWTIGQEAHHEINIERSRFIGHAAFAATEAEVKAYIGKIRQEYADATHNCYAYRIGAGESPLTYYNDHGEPTGTAGKPILNAILQANLTQTVVVVTRYFGGKKLGVRGLIDAYHRTAAEVLSIAGKQLWIEGSEWRIELPYGLWQNLQRQIAAAEGNILQTEYLEKIHCQVWIPLEFFSAFRDKLAEFPEIMLQEATN